MRKTARLRSPLPFKALQIKALPLRLSLRMFGRKQKTRHSPKACLLPIGQFGCRSKRGLHLIPFLPFSCRVSSLCPLSSFCFTRVSPAERFVYILFNRLDGWYIYQTFSGTVIDQQCTSLVWICQSTVSFVQHAPVDCSYLNKRKKPQTSSTTPMMGQPISTTKTPPRKKPVAFILCFWKKKRNVLSSPMTKASPATNRIYRKNVKKDKKIKKGGLVKLMLLRNTNCFSFRLINFKLGSHSSIHTN